MTVRNKTDDFVGFLIEREFPLILALVYSARAQGFRAGIESCEDPREDLEEPKKNEKFSPIKRAIIIEYPEHGKPITWWIPEMHLTIIHIFGKVAPKTDPPRRASMKAPYQQYPWRAAS